MEGNTTTCLQPLPLAPHRCCSAPHQLPLATAIYNTGAVDFRTVLYFIVEIKEC